MAVGVRDVVGWTGGCFRHPTLPLLARSSQAGRRIGAHHAQLGHIFSAIAVVHHGGLGLAITEGIRLMSHLQFDWRVFDEPRDALTWLDYGGASALANEVDEILAAAAGGGLHVYDVRAYCAAHLCGATVQGAARELRLSTRTLQRRLAEHETSFQRLLDEARIARAKVLLASTSLPIADVARNVGVEARSFTTLFRRVAGRNPTAFRAESSAR